MPINESDFAEDCVDPALRFGVNPQYLMAVAKILSGINDDTVGTKIGPFRITQTEWNEKGSDPTFELSLQPDQIKRPGMQCIFAALMTFRAQKKLLEDLERFPSPEELYAVWPNVPPPGGQTPQQALQAAMDATRAFIKSAVDA